MDRIDYGEITKLLAKARKAREQKKPRTLERAMAELDDLSYAFRKAGDFGASDELERELSVFKVALDKMKREKQAARHARGGNPRTTRFSEDKLSELEEEFASLALDFDGTDWPSASARDAASMRKKFGAVFLKLQKMALSPGGPGQDYLRGYQAQYGMRINSPAFLATGASVGAKGSPARERQAAIRAGRHARGDNPVTKGKVDQDAARELDLYIENEYGIYRMKQQIDGNLAQFKAKGTFSFDGAIKAYSHLVNRAAKEYRRQHGSMTDVWHKMFTPATRAYVSEQLAEDFRKRWNDKKSDDRKELISLIPTKKWRAIAQAQLHEEGGNPWYGEPERHSEAAEKGWDGLTSTRAGRAQYPRAAALSKARKKTSRKKPARKKPARKKTSRKSPVRKKSTRKKAVRKKTGRAEMTPKERELKRRMGKLVGRK